MRSSDSLAPTITASVDGVHGSVDVAGVVGAEPGDQGGDLFGFSVAAQRVGRGEHVVDGFGVVGVELALEAAHHAGLDRAGADGVDTDRWRKLLRC